MTPSATLSLNSVDDEVVIPDGITAISYTLTEDEQEITREIAVEPSDVVKYYREEDDYYTLAVYDNTGVIKSKGYTMHSDNVPNISINYSEEVNNNFTSSDEYNGYVALTEVDYSADTEFVVPAGVTKIEYSAGSSGARIAEVEAGDILEYTADPNDSTKFTLTVYDKDKNKKRDLYTWNNDNLHFSYGTSKSYNNKDSESSYEDVSYSLPVKESVQFLSSGTTWEIPKGVNRIYVKNKDPNSAYWLGDIYADIVDGDTEIECYYPPYDYSAYEVQLVGYPSGTTYFSVSNKKYRKQILIYYGTSINRS